MDQYLTKTVNFLIVNYGIHSLVFFNDCRYGRQTTIKIDALIAPLFIFNMEEGFLYKPGTWTANYVLFGSNAVLKIAITGNGYYAKTLLL